MLLAGDAHRARCLRVLKISLQSHELHRRMERLDFGDAPQRWV